MLGKKSTERLGEREREDGERGDKDEGMCGVIPKATHLTRSVFF
jgi:hypothetical protein